MQYEVTESAEGVLVRLSGRLDAYSMPVVEQALLKAVADSGGRVTVDCAQVSYVSSAGLRVLLVAAKAVRAKGRTLKLAGVLPEVLDVVSLAGMQSFFAVES